ncbi:MAG: hypothetical protein DRQ14_04330 [Candidatus Latescibacterota bacterium]|nr:MAG: hypothetical protein DRQ14_04330 [Candidatus Latescibacterota bacterium]HDH99763.1 hypothetical protein [Bacillota bacterium]
MRAWCVLSRLSWAVLSIFLLGQADAWWERGHRIATEAVMRMLPGDMPRFFRASGDVLVPLSAAPDRWKKYGDVVHAGWRWDHFMDLELLDLPLGEFLEKFPDRFSAMEHWCGGDGRIPGFLPYHILELYEALKGVFGELKEKPSDPSLQVQALFFAGSLAHFAEDLSQPLHLTVHYDGRVDEKGDVVSNEGIHERFEGPLVEHIDLRDVLPYMHPPEELGDVKEALVRAMERSYGFVKEVYALDDRGELEKATPMAVRFAAMRLAEGAQLVANLWYTAWAKGGR